MPWTQLRRAPALADQPSPLALGSAAPHPSLFTHLQCVFKTGDPHSAVGTNVLGLYCFILVVRIEHTWVEPPARSKLTPYDLFDRHEPCPPIGHCLRDPSRNRPESRFAVVGNASPECAISARFSGPEIAAELVNSFHSESHRFAVRRVIDLQADFVRVAGRELCNLGVGELERHVMHSGGDVITR